MYLRIDELLSCIQTYDLLWVLLPPPYRKDAPRTLQ